MQRCDACKKEFEDLIPWSYQGGTAQLCQECHDINTGKQGALQSRLQAREAANKAVTG